MDSRIAWTLTAVGLVTMFLAARYYVVPQLEAQQETIVVPLGDPVQRDRPRRDRDVAKPAPLTPAISTVIGRVMALSEMELDALPEGVENAHAALESLSTLDVDLTPAQVTREKARLAKLEQRVEGLDPAQPALKAHVLAARVAFAEKVGSPDPEAAEKLAKARSARPRDFSWE